MSDLQHDIENYRRGLLSAKQMHALEEKALSDPFLADALEGVESIGAEDFASEVSELQSKLSKTKRNYWPYGIAASLLLLIAFSYLIFKPSIEKPSSKELTLAADSTKVKSIEKNKVKDSTAIATTKEALLTYDQPKQKKSSAKKAEVIKLDTSTQLASTQSIASNQSALGSAKAYAVPETITITEKEIAQESDQEVPEQKKPQPAAAPVSIAEALQKSEVASEPATNRTKRLATSSTTISKDKISNRTITGVISSSDDGSPLPGVNINIPNTTLGTVSDVAGNYSITVSDSTQHLAFSFMGLQTKQVAIDRDVKVNVKLSADVTQLSEVVVVGYGADKPDEKEDVPVKIAAPIGGRRAYNNYLEKNLKYPEQALQNKIEGKVTVQFMVNLQGGLTDFAVVRGLGYGCDEEVIRLVKEGPKWNPSVQNETPLESTVRVRMRFKIPK